MLHDVGGVDNGVCCIKLLYRRKEFCGLDVLERVQPQKISPVEEDDSVSCVPLSWCLRSVWWLFITPAVKV